MWSAPPCVGFCHLTACVSYDPNPFDNDRLRIAWEKLAAARRIHGLTTA